MRIVASLLSIFFGIALMSSIAGTVSAETAAKPASPAVHMTKDGKPRSADVRAACRSEANGKGLSKGDAYKSFMRDCIGKQRPDLVKAYDCRAEAKAKKLEKDERKAFMVQCKARQ